MSEDTHGPGRLLPRAELDSLLGRIRGEGYELIGPTVRDGAVVYESIDGVDDLPVGWTDVQSGGSYRLERRADESLFGFNVGPSSWKEYLFPPRVRLWKASREKDGLEISPENGQPPKYAFLGVRSCELTAIGLQDRVFLDGTHVDPVYRSRRADAFLIAVQCGSAGGTCFCASMGTGPRATQGFDLALTELVGEGRHDFLLEIGSDRGREMVEPLGLRPASEPEKKAALEMSRRAEKSMGRKMEAPGVSDLLHRNVDHPRWRETSLRCLVCGNCTMVCPTCFCTTVEDRTNLAGTEAERWRHWDSCFSTEFSYIHGGNVRQSRKSRYRQWITHKLASWHDQFDASGCVGCGRCITWCPVGIDITEEVAAVRESETAALSATEG